MRKIIYLFFAFLLASCASSQGINHSLKAELDQILHTDQELRKLFTPDITNDEKSRILAAFGYTLEDFDRLSWWIVEKQDSINLQKVEAIIKKHGYPGKSLVGEPTNKAVFYVIQHSDKIETYFPLIEQAGKRNEIPLRLVGMMHDRLLMDQGKEQIYGTQIRGQRIINKETNAEEWIRFLWPVADPEKVDERRKAIGIEETVEEYVKSMGIEHRLYSLEEIQQLTKK